MIFEVQPNIWYNLEHHTISKMIWRHERAIFADFKKIILPRSQNSISTVKKSFFQTLMRIHFWVIGCFFLILWTRCAFEKCLLESKQTLGIIQSITRQVKMIWRHERAIFVDFKKLILRRSQIQWPSKKAFFKPWWGFIVGS